MKFTSLLFAYLCASPLAAQSVALSEDFSGSTFPPAGWSQQILGPNLLTWEKDTPGQRAWHQDQPGSTTENYLMSPPMDLSAFSQAFVHFDGETNFAAWLANHPSSIGDGVSNVEITTDGGITWTFLWTDTSLNSGDTYSPSIDISTYAGLTNVQIGFYFYGTFAQEWWVDNVIVDDQPVPVLASITNPNNGHPYFLLGQADFATANAKAIELGGNLVSIDSGAENSWLLSTFGNFGGLQRNLMLGLNDVNLEGSFEWVSGEALTYTNWAAGEPNNGGGGNEDFVQMVSGGQWNDFSGSNANAVVEISQARIQATPLVGGQLATITVNGLRVGSSVIMVFSTNGAGPTTTPFGVIAVDPDIITPTFPAMSGQFNLSTYIPTALSGTTLFGQAIQFNADSTTDLSEPFSAPIQ